MWAPRTASLNWISLWVCVVGGEGQDSGVSRRTNSLTGRSMVRGKGSRGPYVGAPHVVPELDQFVCVCGGRRGESVRAARRYGVKVTAVDGSIERVARAVCGRPARRP